MPVDGKSIEPSLGWAGAEQLPVFAVNRVAAEIVDIDEIVVTLGHASPVRASAREERAGEPPLPSRPVLGVARIGFTSKRLGELIEVLQETRAAHELLRERSMGLEDGGA
jgi:hypothetical protein